MPQKSPKPKKTKISKEEEEKLLANIKVKEEQSKCNNCRFSYPYVGIECKGCEDNSHYIERIYGLCGNCGKHKGTQVWIGDGGELAMSHGVYAMWCKCCCLKAQLEYAKNISSKIPQLEAELAKGEEHCEDMVV
jgi:hypothetical protein